MRLKFVNVRGYKNRSVRHHQLIPKDGPPFTIPNTAGRLLVALMFSEVLTNDEIMEILWPDPDAMPDLWASSIRCEMVKLRTFLKPDGIKIKVHPGFGYQLIMPDG